MSSLQVIIVNYNAGDWLSRCIKSVLQYSDADVVVVDNNSTDNSVEQTQRAKLSQARLGWQLNTANVGFAAANNQALEESDTDYVLLLNPDCEVNQHTIPLMLAAFEHNPSLGLASCRILNEDGSLQSTCRRRFPTPWSAFVRLFQLHRLFPNNPKFANFDYGDVLNNSVEVEPVDAISGAFMMVRKAALHDVGLLDEAYFMHCEDLDWCKRFAQTSWEVGFVSAASVIHAKGVSSRSRPIRVLWTLHKGMNRFFDKHYRQEYAWPIRYTVKIGIMFSFLWRSVTSCLARK